MKYFCHNPECPISFKKAINISEGNCVMCEMPLQPSLPPYSYYEFSDWEYNVISNYPTVIAIPFRDMLTEGNYFVKINLLKDVFCNSLKLLSLFLITEYLNRKTKDTQFSNLIRSNLITPSMGNWNKFLQDGTRYLEESETLVRFPGLIFVYKKLSEMNSFFTDDISVDTGGGTETVRKEMNPVNALLNFRNRYLAHAQTIRGIEAGKLFEKYYPVLKEFLSLIYFCTKINIVYSHPGETIDLKGCDLHPISKKKESGQRGHQVWLIDEHEQKVTTIPFFFIAKDVYTVSGPVTELFIYEKILSDSTAFYSCGESGEVRTAPVNIWSKMI